MIDIRDVFKTLSNTYDGGFMWKQLTNKSSYIDVQQGPEYASAYVAINITVFVITGNPC